MRRVQDGSVQALPRSVRDQIVRVMRLALKCDTWHVLRICRSGLSPSPARSRNMAGHHRLCRVCAMPEYPSALCDEGHVHSLNIGK
jgi:hypothetical protein